MRSEKIQFPGTQGLLAARLDQPDSQPRAYVLFAHRFTCTKDVLAATHVYAELTNHGIAVLRFAAPFGDFANTNFFIQRRPISGQVAL